ncbi:MAG: sugar ABC transporter permease [Chloroflexi bacterium]|jgi:multiple sugar transport system permease protein|nr:MAG: sugar ABC transporter permease [Chloroflexota bacterium]
MTTHRQPRLAARREALYAWAFVAPSLIGFLIFFAVPSVRGLLMSFTNWDLLRPAKFVGLANYVRLFGDADFLHALRVTGYYVLLNIPIQTTLALGIAVMMDKFSKSTAIRGILVLPWLLPNIVVALIWLWLLDPTMGFLNQIIMALGFQRQPFLGSIDQAIPTIAAINIWRHAGYTAILIYAGLQTIPKEVYEAASIDGANERQMFFGITIPLLRPVLVFVLVTTIIGSFQIFDTIAITTKGGPVDATRVVYWYIYEYAFVRFKMGYATTISVALFVILITITFIQMRYFNANSSDLD